MFFNLHFEADILAAGIIQPDNRVVELRPLRRIKPGHPAPALVQQLLGNLLGQLLFLAGKELIILPQTEGTFLAGTVIIALSHINRGAAAGAFAYDLLTGVEAVCLCIGEEGVRFDQRGSHIHDPGEELVPIGLTALDLHQGIFPFRSHGR